MASACLAHSLAGNDIGVEGGQAIAEALNSGTAVLKTLDLRHNNLGAEGSKAITEALKSGMAVLKKCDLRYNSSMGESGRRMLRDAVKDREGFELLV